MATTRQLPEEKNHLLEEDRAPSHEILVERRCLGQTELKVKPGLVGTSNATKPDNLGVLDYAHLRVPLPQDLSRSGIFTKGRDRKYPEAYFLMRRSTDGFVSATGMFKAAYPHASLDEEAEEKDYIKGLPTTSTEEVAGNVWIHPDQALELAEEYGIRLWIAALLDQEPITHGTSDPNKTIRSPPAYRVKDMANGTGRTPATDKKKTADGKSSRRGARSVRSESPSQTKPSARKVATPRKPRKGRGGLGKVDEDDDGGAATNGDASAPTDRTSDTVKVEVETTTQPGPAGGEDVETTKVNIEMPAGAQELELPHDAEGMLATARAMVSEAERIGGGGASSGRGKGKRKAKDMTTAGDDDDADADADAPEGSGKRVKLDVELKKERIKRRAVTGIAASLAIGALIPTLLTAFS